MAEQKQIPVYLFTGFLDGGKTKFIQETLCDARFNKGERTLLLVCEQGVEEYEPVDFTGRNVFIEALETQENLSAERLAFFTREYAPERVVVEYNGMWMLDELFTNMPESWVVAQEFMFAQAGTFALFNANMRQLVYDKLKSCELVVFNRCGPDVDRDELHKIVRAVSRRADIAYEAPNGDVSYDDIEDPLPFDLNSDPIVIAERDYALWYRDLNEETDKYEGKTVRFLARAVQSPKLPADTLVVGRQVMTCCVQDIQFTGLICKWPQAKLLTKGEWVMITARVNVKWHKGYGGRGPVLTATDITPAKAPQEPVATFY